MNPSRDHTGGPARPDCFVTRRSVPPSTLVTHTLLAPAPNAGSSRLWAMYLPSGDQQGAPVPIDGFSRSAAVLVSWTGFDPSRSASQISLAVVPARQDSTAMRFPSGEMRGP